MAELFPVKPRRTTERKMQEHAARDMLALRRNVKKPGASLVEGVTAHMKNAALTLLDRGQHATSEVRRHTIRGIKSVLYPVVQAIDQKIEQQKQAGGGEVAQPKRTKKLRKGPALIAAGMLAGAAALPTVLGGSTSAPVAPVSQVRNVAPKRPQMPEKPTFTKAAWHPSNPELHAYNGEVHFHPDKIRALVEQNGIFQLMIKKKLRKQGITDPKAAEAFAAKEVARVMVAWPTLERAVNDLGKELGINPFTLFTVIYSESAFDPQAEEVAPVSPQHVGRGLIQFTGGMQKFFPKDGNIAGQMEGIKKYFLQNPANFARADVPYDIKMLIHFGVNADLDLVHRTRKEFEPYVSMYKENPAAFKDLYRKTKQAAKRGDPAAKRLASVLRYGPDTLHDTDKIDLYAGQLTECIDQEKSYLAFAEAPVQLAQADTVKKQ